MKILLDCDGVLADFVAAALVVANDLDPSKGWAVWTPADVTDWQIENLLPEYLRSAFAERLNAPGFCASILPKAGCGIVPELRALGHSVEIVTQPLDTNPHWEKERLEGVQKYFGDVKVHFASDKSSFAGAVFVDDKPSNVRAWQIANPAGQAFLMHVPYNVHAQDLTRIFVLSDLLHYLRSVPR